MSSSKLLYQQIHKQIQVKFRLNVITFDLIDQYKFTMKVPNLLIN